MTILPIFVGRGLMMVILIVVFLALQYRYWYGEYGYTQLRLLQEQVDTQEAINLAQTQKNMRLRADVKDLKSELVAIEEHARIDLGLIKPKETFVQLSTAPVVYREAPMSFEPDAVEILDVMTNEGE